AQLLQAGGIQGPGEISKNHLQRIKIILSLARVGYEDSNHDRRAQARGPSPDASAARDREDVRARSQPSDGAGSLRAGAPGFSVDELRDRLQDARRACEDGPVRKCSPRKRTALRSEHVAAPPPRL